MSVVFIHLCSFTNVEVKKVKVLGQDFLVVDPRQYVTWDNVGQENPSAGWYAVDCLRKERE